MPLAVQLARRTLCMTRPDLKWLGRGQTYEELFSLRLDNLDQHELQIIKTRRT